MTTPQNNPINSPASNIPPKTVDSPYDKIMRRLWEMEQRLVFMEKSVRVVLDVDAVYHKYIEVIKRLEKLEGTQNDTAKVQ